MLASLAVGEALVILKILFLVLLYLFIWRIVRTASRDLRLPQESILLAPAQAEAAGLLARREREAPGRLVVLASPAREPGEVLTLDSDTLTIGRDAQNAVSLGSDEFASARHARVEPRRGGVWVEDVGSTNGTFVNGTRVGEPRRLSPGDVIRIGETDLRFER